MLKRDEVADPNSCLNRAADNEPVFVLRGRDPAAVAAVEAWIRERIHMSLNGPEDAKIVEAHVWIDSVRYGDF